MNSNTNVVKLGTTLVAAAVASVLAACASAPARPEGAAQARARLTQLQNDPSLANRAPLAMQAAEGAVLVAEQPQVDQELATYRVYMADRKVDLARAQAETQLAEDQRAALRTQSDQARLDARTHQVEIAQKQAAVARADSAEQRLAAGAARSDADAANQAAVTSNQQAADARNETAAANLAAANSQQQASDARNDTSAANLAAANSQQQASDARNQTAAANLAAANSQQQASDARNDTSAANLAAANSQQQATDARNQTAAANLAAANSQQQTADLQQQLDVLHAKPTDRGLVVTLGDVLFMSGKATLRDGPSGNLDRLVAFLNRYPERTARIEGYTDSIGSSQHNRALGQRRADSVMSYLVAQGVGSYRLMAVGEGDSLPVADNDSASGRQQNRRVEVIINNPPVALR